MQYQPLGNSGLVVSRACLGTMVFGEENDRGADEETSLEMIERFIDAGGNFIDSADVYAGGRSEEIVGKALSRVARDRIILATKVRMPVDEGPNDIGLSRKHITDGVEASLRRLGTDYIDLYYTHMWDPVTPLDETLRALDDLVGDGKVRYIGVSNFTAWQVMKALSVSEQRNFVRYVAGQYQHSLVMRDIEREFDGLFADQGIGEIPWGALGGGFLSGKYRRGERPEEGRLAMMPDSAEEAWSRRDVERNWRTLDAVGELAEAHGATYSQVALAWLLRRPTVTSVLLGVRTPDQLADNLAAVDLELSDSEYERLDEVSRPDPGYPYRMISAYGARVF
jgi:aryl-alcohol dehydrogenase-like predicted oxidoreductase